MNFEDNLRTTPSKGAKPGSSNSPSTRSSAKKGTKNAKITNFFTKVNSPLARTSSNSNADIADDSNGDASSSSMKAPLNLDDPAKKSGGGGNVGGGLAIANKDYVFIVPSSDDDTKGSTTKSSRASKRKRPPSVHSGNSKSSDGFVLTTNTNNELGLSRKRRAPSDIMGGSDSSTPKPDSNSNQEASNTPTRSLSRDSTPTNQSGPKTIHRIRPTMIGNRTKMIDFQSVPSDLNLPRDQAQELIQRLFLVKMPEDFYLFWDFAKTINHRKPCSAFAHTHLELNLVGPFDVLSGLITDFHGFSREHLLRHCRFYYDPPEFQTVIVKKDDKFTHYGYYRDEPAQEKPVVVMNRAAVGGQIHEEGDNLFTLLRSELETAIGALSKSSQEVPTLTSSSSRTGPRSSLAATAAAANSKAAQSLEKQDQLEKAKAKQELTIIRDKLLDFCSSHENLSSESWSRTNTRRSKRCAKTLNTFGIVVPRTSGDVGYRNLGLTDAKLKTMLERISEYKDDKSKCGLYKELHGVINNTNMANDECDFGMGLELGLDLFYQGDPFFHKDIEFLLQNAYTLLERSEFLEILKTHLEERKQGDKVSLLD